ncbi:MAG TPA: hypothetical protein VM845_05725 [Burkholderiaceae bacterium]|nr:hypothetical protein [Burkholderiaceae bacterium]
MIKILRMHLLAAIFLIAGGAHAQVDNATAESLLRKSGLWEQLASIAPQVQAGLSQSLAQLGTKPTDVEAGRISRVIGDAYAATRLRAVSMSVVSQKLNANHVPELQRWFDSPLGRSIAKLEEAASAAQGGDSQALLQQGVATLQKLPQTQRQLLEELVTETHAAEALVQITIKTAVAAQRAAAGAAPNAPRMSEGDLQAALEAQRPQLLKAISAMALASFAGTYATLSPSQMQDYVNFIKSGAGSHFNTIGIVALDAALTDAAAELGRNLPRTKEAANS